MGILMLCFGGLGLLHTLALSALLLGRVHGGDWLVLELTISALHLAAGVTALRYHRAAPPLATIYGAATVLVGIAVVLSHACQPIPAAPDGQSPFMHGIGHAMEEALIGLAILVQVGLRTVWAIVAVVIMNSVRAQLRPPGPRPS
jgi:hypothetical protein